MLPLRGNSAEHGAWKPLPGTPEACGTSNPHVNAVMNQETSDSAAAASQAWVYEAADLKKQPVKRAFKFSWAGV